MLRLEEPSKDNEDEEEPLRSNSGSSTFGLIFPFPLIFFKYCKYITSFYKYQGILSRECIKIKYISIYLSLLKYITLTLSSDENYQCQTKLDKSN